MPIPPRGSRRPSAFASTAVDALEPFAHAFTHFTLEVTPWLVEAKGAPPAARRGVHDVASLQEAAAAALPAPVKKLLARLPRRDA